MLARYRIICNSYGNPEWVRKTKGLLSPDDKLCSALRLGQTRLAEHLIKNDRANPNVMSPDGLRPLHYAVQLADDEFMRFLLNEGANPTAYDQYGLMPIHKIVNTTFVPSDAIALLSIILDTALSENLTIAVP